MSVEMWRQAVSDEQTQHEADFIQRMLGVAPPAAILDVPCGLGRLSINLATRGFTITGVDISSQSLDEASNGAGKRGLNISWHNREMRDLPWPVTFDGAFCFGNSFGYLDDQGNTRFLEAVNRVMKPGARFILDASSVAENVLPRIRDHTEMPVGDILFIEDNHYDHELGRLDTEYTFVRGDKTEKRFGSHRIYNYREIRTLLTDAGFGEIQAFGSTSGEPFKFGQQGLYFVSIKGN